MGAKEGPQISSHQHLVVVLLWDTPQIAQS